MHVEMQCKQEPAGSAIDQGWNPWRTYTGAAAAIIIYIGFVFGTGLPVDRSLVVGSCLAYTLDPAFSLSHSVKPHASSKLTASQATWMKKKEKKNKDLDWIY
jgi:hypothetical protein